MSGYAAGLVAALTDVDHDLEREFEERLVESSTLAFRLAYSVLRHREEAEDVAQEAFAKAYRSFRQLRDRDRFRAWLARLTWRLAIDRQRSNRRRLTRETVLPEVPSTADAIGDMEARDRAAALWRAIDALPEKFRLVVVLVSIEGHDTASVSRLLGTPEGTVKSRLFEARRKLKEQLSWMTTR